MTLPKLKVKSFVLENNIFQGGLGAGFSLSQLAGAVSCGGGLGIVSGAGLRAIVSSREGRKVNTYFAVRTELEKARDLAKGRPIGINIMCALVGDYEDTVKASIDFGVEAIISGAGLPLGLPTIRPPGKTALIPIVSSARALQIIIRRWERTGCRPDAVVLEGPLAGGHLGFKVSEIEDPEYNLEKLLPPILEIAHKHGDFPVIVAGGIFTHEDILKFVSLGASGVQIGTRFLATDECSASNEYKQAVVKAGIDDITVVSYPDNLPASPCGLPFRILKTSPMYNTRRKARCNNGYVMQKGEDGKLSVCPAMPNNKDNQDYLCICPGLLSSAGFAPDEPSLYTVGVNAYRIDKILSVSDLMSELRG